MYPAGLCIFIVQAIDAENPLVYHCGAMKESQ
jgi:hypothetical protein